MAFMELFTEYNVWYTVTTQDGESLLISESVIGRLPIPDGHNTATEDDTPPDDWKRMGDMVRNFIGKPDVVEVTAKSGWCACYSAPGYMDCTDWCGPYETEQEAVDKCREMYGEEDEDETDEDALLEPDSDVTTNGERVCVYTVMVPGDYADTVEQLGERALYVAREEASDYVMPATWNVEHVAGEVGDYEVTFKVTRTSNAV